MTASLAFLAHRHEHFLQSSIRNVPISYGFLQVILLKPVGLLGFKHLDDLKQVLELVDAHHQVTSLVIDYHG